MFCTFSLPNVLFATAACIYSTSELQKVVRTRHVLYIFTSEYAFRHSGVQFFDIWTCKSARNTSCFVHFHFRMCFSPQRRAFFRRLNVQKCSEHVMFCAFSLPNVLFATAACNFWFLPWPPDSAPAALTGLLLDWPDTRIMEKTQRFATSLTFGADVFSFFWLSRYCIFFLPTWLPVSSTFQLSILSEVCYLNFLRSLWLFYVFMSQWQQEIKRQLPSRSAGTPCDSIAAFQQHIMAVATPKLRATTTIIAEAAALLAWLSPDPHPPSTSRYGRSEHAVECCVKLPGKAVAVATHVNIIDCHIT